MKRKLFISFVLGCVVQLSYGQLRKNIEVEGVVNPWVGGLNVPQFSEADFNNDGLMDIYIFDKTGSVSIVYLQEKKAGVSSYHFAPEYADELPKELANWVLLRDFDKDGAMDIFASALGIEPVNGVIVYKGYYQNNKLKFNRVQLGQGEKNFLYILGGAPYTQIYVSSEDYPSFDDIDGDGDLDIITYSISGSHAEWYKNTSVESGKGLSALTFVLEDNCWGKFFERGTNEIIDLSNDINTCKQGFADGIGTERNQRHAGSTILTFDADGDGDREALIGDISFYSLNLLTNTGTNISAWMTDQDKFFPSYDVPFKIITFPVAFYLDVDFDGKKDLVAAPNKDNSTEDYNNVYFYKNTTDNTKPRFKYIDSTHFSKDILDFGSASKIAVADINADGLKDILVGSFFYMKERAEVDNRLTYLKNIGTPSQPKFKVEDKDFLTMSQYVSIKNLSPAFGDLDGDGDEDLFVGNSEGKLFFYENMAGAGQPMKFIPILTVFNDKSTTELYDVGSDSTPLLIDLNEDGLLDVVIGENFGNINFYPNTGTKTKPQFLNSNAIQNFGRIYTPTLTNTNPFIWKNGDHFEMVVGSGARSSLRHYMFTKDQLSDSFKLITNNFLSIREGAQSNIFLADIDNDNKLDAFVGNQRGGISVFGTDFSTALEEVEPTVSATISIFPNPASDNFTIVTDAEIDLSIIDILGEQKGEYHLQTGEHHLPTERLSNGTYILIAKTKDNTLIHKKIVVCKK